MFVLFAFGYNHHRNRLTLNVYRHGHKFVAGVRINKKLQTTGNRVRVVAAKLSLVSAHDLASLIASETQKRLNQPIPVAKQIVGVLEEDDSRTFLEKKVNARMKKIKR